MTETTQQTPLTSRRCGYVALVGRPNVGKSTLLNHLLGQKISITSRKPQTTRHRIHGILTDNNCQMVFVDTPGVHQERDKAINRAMNKAALSTMSDVDVVVFLVDRLQWTDEDELVLENLKQLSVPIILAINKVDKVIDKNKLLPHMQTLASYLSWSELIPISAKNGHNQHLLLDAIRSRLPESDFYFDEEQVTDRSEKFIASELIREKLMRQLGDEVPYKVAVEIEQYQEEPNLVRIDALIWV
ncbi:GTPase Era, partial [bacterium]|nr:GTPase Era [bacterium]